MTGDDNDRQYTPQAGFTGTDQFTWKVSDSAAESKTATVTITVVAEEANEKTRQGISFPVR